jgi:hypothetical protein
MKKTSKNELAKKLVGERIEKFRGTIPAVSLDYPVEIGYHCPVCKYKSVYKGNFDERLEWSEYNGFIWCSICNKDYPSALCMPKIDEAIDTYLSCIEDAIIRAKTKDGLTPKIEIKNILSNHPKPENKRVRGKR